MPPPPLNPHTRGGPKYFIFIFIFIFFGGEGLRMIDHSDPIASNIFGEPMTSNIISVILGDASDPPPLTPLWRAGGA